ncbi:MAG: hypothetical protein QOD46_1416 [Actinomycetota bacterium]|nr:hypothetical protein [Actinomycetota bacterium]
MTTTMTRSMTAPRSDEHFFRPDHDSEPVFIVGMGRSGTTMLRLMLHRHPDLAVLSETSFGALVWERRWGFPMVDPIEPYQTRLLNSFVRRLHSEDMEDLQIDWGEYRRKVLAGPNSLNRFLRILGEMWAQELGKTRWAEKTPTHVHYLPVFRKMWPKMTAINAVRDPRAVAASWIKTGFSRVSDPVAVAVEWRRSVRAAETAASGGAAVLTVRYEDLVEQPEAVLRKVCAHSSLDYEDQLLEFHEAADESAPHLQWMQNLNQPLSTGNVDKWKEQLSTEEIFYIEVVAGSALEEYGYEAVSDAAELQRVRAQAGRLERAYSQSVRADMRPLREMVSVDVDAYRGLLEE